MKSFSEKGFICVDRTVNIDIICGSPVMYEVKRNHIYTTGRSGLSDKCSLTSR